ncbi:MAG: hypothetical protein Q7S47_00690 [bacterium]|nr:hypothetical protein [bacterium]
MKNYSRKKSTVGKVAFRTPSRILVASGQHHAQVIGTRFGKKGLLPKK